GGQSPARDVGQLVERSPGCSSASPRRRTHASSAASAPAGRPYRADTIVSRGPRANVTAIWCIHWPEAARSEEVLMTIEASGIDHIVLHVSDVERARKFYADVL